MLSLSLSANRGRSYLTEQMAYIARYGSDTAREWLSTMYLRAVEGKLDAESSSNLEAYADGCKKNTMKTMMSKEVPILSEEEVEAGQTGIGEMFLAYTDVHLKMVEEMTEFRNALEQVLDMADMIEIENNVSLVHTMIQAWRGNEESRLLLRGLVKEYFGLDKLLKTVMRQDGWQNYIGGVAVC